MEGNETNKKEEGQLAEVQKEIDKQVTKWVKIAQGEAVILNFTGRTWIREAEFKDSKTGSPTAAKMVDFEIDEKTPDGEQRILSRNIQNSDVPVLVRYLKEGRKTLMLSKDKSNKMSVAAVKGAPASTPG